MWQVKHEESFPAAAQVMHFLESHPEAVSVEVTSKATTIKIFYKMKYTTLIVVALLATTTLAASGCDSKKCVICAAAGNDSTCMTCHKSKPALPSGVTTYMNCSGTITAGCVLEGVAGCEVCDVSSHYRIKDTKTCQAYDS